MAIWFINGGTVTSTASLGKVAGSSIVGVGDLNGDGKTDILWRNTVTDEVSIWLMLGGVVKTALALGFVPQSWIVAGVGDFNGDGKTDVLWRNTSGATAIWFMNGGTVTSAASLGTVSTNWTPQ